MSKEDACKITWWWLPLYLRISRKYWLCMWSCPTLPATFWDFCRAIRITIRKGKYHSEIIAVIKRGD